MGFVIANTHPGREKSIGQQRPKNLDLPSVLPFPLFFFVSRWGFLFLRADIVQAKTLTDGELGFHYAYISACVSVWRKMTKDNGVEVTHAFGGKCSPENSLTSISVFIFLSSRISRRMVTPHLYTFNYDLRLCLLWRGSMQCKYIGFTQKGQERKQCSLYLFNIVMAGLFPFNVSFQVVIPADIGDTNLILQPILTPIVTLPSVFISI